MSAAHGGAGARPSTGPAPLAVYVVDDSPAFLRAAAAVVAALPDFELVGSSDSGADAIRVLVEQAGTIDLVLLDVNLPDVNGPAVAERVRRRWPALPIVFVSTLSSADLPEDLLAVEGTTFVSKSDFGPVALERLGTALAGRPTLHP